MQHRPVRRLVPSLIVLAALVAAGPVVAAPPPRTGNPLVDRALDVIAAVEAKDDATLASFAAEGRFDAFDVANAILIRAIYPKTKPEAPSMLAAAARWGEVVASRPEGCGVASLVARWRAYGEADFDRERRLVLVPMKVQAAAARRAWDEMDAVTREASADLAAARHSLSAWAVYAERARLREQADGLEESESDYVEAATRAEALGSSRRAGIAWDRAAGCAFEAGRWAQARERAGRAISAFLACGFTKNVTTLRLNVASAFLREGRVADARAATEALLTDPTLRPAERARATLAISDVRVVEGDVPGAQRAFAEGLALHAAAGADRAELLRVRFAFAHGLLEADAWAPALEAFEPLAAELRPDDALAIRFLAPRSMAILLRALGRPSEALPFAERALAVAVESGDVSTIGAARSEVVLTLTLLGRHGEAAALFAPPRGASPEPAAEPAVPGPGGADAAIDAARRAIRAYEAAANANFAVDVRRSLVALLLAAGRRDEARAEVAAIRRLGGGDETSRTGFLAAVADAEAALAEDRPEESVAASLHALSIHRALARGLAAADALGTRADAAKVADLGLAAAARWADAGPAARAEAALAAFELAESSRALLLAEGLRNRSSVLWSSLPPELVALDRDSRRELEDARARAMGVSLAAATGARGAEVSPGDALVEARRRRDAALTRIGREARRVSSFLDPAPPDVAALRALLAPDGAFVEFQDTGDAIFAIVVRRDAASLRRVGGGADVRARIDAWLRLVSTPGTSDARAAAAVYDAVWRPLEEDLAGVRRVSVTSEGALAYLPFDALVRAEGASAHRLVETLDVTYVPSAGVWVALAAERTSADGARVLAVGDPDLGPLSASLARLPGGADEARDLVGRFDAAARRLFVGAEAGVEPVLGALASEGARYRVVHFACHGTSDPSSAYGAGLLLAGGALLDGDRLARARVPADLVTLSACESARGQLARGEGVLGLARSFFLAGASRVVTSGWLVSDRDSRRFMGGFYEAHLGKGLPSSAALRAAKLAALAGGGESAHPARWATFTLWGLPE